MDFKTLEQQYSDFWNHHDYNKAIVILKNLSNYFGSDFSLYSPEMLLQPYQQLISYAGRNNLDPVSIDVNKITYQDMLKDFASYWNKQIQSIQDLKQKLDAQNQLSVFDQLISGIGSVLSTISNPFFLVALFGTILLYLYKK